MTSSGWATFVSLGPSVVICQLRVSRHCPPILSCEFDIATPLSSGSSRRLRLHQFLSCSPRLPVLSPSRFRIVTIGLRPRRTRYRPKRYVLALAGAVQRCHAECNPKWCCRRILPPSAADIKAKAVEQASDQKKIATYSDDGLQIPIELVDVGEDVLEALQQPPTCHVSMSFHPNAATRRQTSAAPYQHETGTSAGNIHGSTDIPWQCHQSAPLSAAQSRTSLYLLLVHIHRPHHPWRITAADQTPWQRFGATGGSDAS